MRFALLVLLCIPLTTSAQAQAQTQYVNGQCRPVVTAIPQPMPRPANLPAWVPISQRGPILPRPLPAPQLLPRWWVRR